ncbi:MAG: hypothetical protein HYZ03_03425 [candidate division NC10 bacterium]|nr:hypothetical protein [candidate division NC10 bacterium]
MPSADGPAHGHHAPWYRLPAPTLTAAERNQLWQGIRTEIEARQGWRVPAILPWLRGLCRRRPILAWAPAVAAAILLLLVPLHLGMEERVLSQAELNAQTTIEQIEAGPGSSVLVLDTPTENLSIIWVMEPP